MANMTSAQRAELWALYMQDISDARESCAITKAQLRAAVQAHDWRTVARLYNGPGNVDTYAGLLERRYARLQAAG